jgi:hypothetical protein
LKSKSKNRLKTKIHLLIVSKCLVVISNLSKIAINRKQFVRDDLRTPVSPISVDGYVRLSNIPFLNIH